MVVNPAPVVYSHPLVIASSVPQQTLVVDQVQTMAPAYGSVYSALPAGCSLEQVQAQNYYRCGSYWYLPQLGLRGSIHVRDSAALVQRSSPGYSHTSISEGPLEAMPRLSAD